MRATEPSPARLQSCLAMIVAAPRWLGSMQAHALRCRVKLLFMHDMDIEASGMTHARQLGQRVFRECDFRHARQPFHSAPVLLNQSADSRLLRKYLNRDALFLFNS